MELPSALTVGPARARVARILRDDLPLVLRFSRAAVFLPGPLGRPRLLASAGETVRDGEEPSRMRRAVVSADAARGPAAVAFGADGGEPSGEALVVPLSIGGALVVYRDRDGFAAAELRHAATTARLVARALAWSAAVS